MKHLIDVYGDNVYINQEQINFIDKTNKEIYKVYFTNGLDRSFAKEQIEKLITNDTEKLKKLVNILQGLIKEDHNVIANTICNQEFLEGESKGYENVIRINVIHNKEEDK